MPNVKKLNLSSTLTWLSLFVITAFLYNFSLKDHIFRADSHIAVLLITALALLVAANFKTLYDKFKSRKEGDCVFISITLVLIPALLLLRNGDIENNNFGKPFFSLYVLLLLLLFVYAKEIQRPALVLTALFTLEHVFFTWFFYFFTDIYKNHVISLFPDFSKELGYQLEQGQMAGITMHYSTNAIYLSIGFIIFCAALIRAKTKKQLIISITSSALTMSALLITGKRGPLLFAVAAVVMTYFACNLKNIKKTLIRTSLILVSAVCIIFAVSVFVPSITEPFDRFFNEKDLTNGRMPMYTLAVDNFKENSVFGIGWGQYKYVYEQSDIKGTQDIMDAHNVYLQLLCEVGIVGTAVFVTLFAYTLWHTFKLIYRRSQKDALSKPLVFSLGIQIYFLLYCMTGNPLYDVFALYPYILGISITLGEQNRENQ